eukprot:g29590.t1
MDFRAGIDAAQLPVYHKHDQQWEEAMIVAELSAEEPKMVAPKRPCPEYAGYPEDCPVLPTLNLPMSMDTLFLHLVPNY